MDMLEKAREIAEKAHAGQVRKGGEPYINHVTRVSQAAAKYGEDAAIAGMLHDVVEDSTITLGDLQKEGFSMDILTAIAYLTRCKTQSYLDYILCIRTAGAKAKNVKLCDLADNLNGATGTLKDKYEMAQWILTH